MSADLPALRREIASQWVALLTWIGIPSTLVLVSEPESASIDTSSPDAEARAIVKAKLAAKRMGDARVHVERWLAVDRDAISSAPREALGPLVRDLGLAHGIAARAGYSPPAKLPEIAVLSETASVIDDTLRPLDVGERAKDTLDAIARAPKGRARMVLPIALGVGAVAVVGAAVGYLRFTLRR